MIRHIAPVVILSLLLAVPATAEVDAAAAQEIARQVAIKIDPALNSPNTKVAKNETDLCVALDVSDPYKVNGELYWKNYTTYEYTKIGVAQYSGIGTQVHAQSASEPMNSPLPPELKARALAWVAYWRPQGAVSPDVKIGARKTKVFLFRFYQGFLGPNAFVGVDSDGKSFELNLGNQLTPWGHDVQAKLRYFKFLALHQD